MKKTAVSPFVIAERIAILCIFFLLVNNIEAQVKIGDTPNVLHPASVLELESTSRALVLTRVNDAQMQLITPLQGAIVYNIDEECIFYFDTVEWKNLCTEGGNQSNDSTTLVDNNDGTFTFTDSNGNETVIPVNSTTGAIASLVDNGNNMFTYTDENGVETVVSFTNNGGGGDIATMVNNNDGTFTFTDANSTETILLFNGVVYGTPGSIFFAGATGNSSEDNDELFWDATNSQLGIGVNALDLPHKLNVNGTVGVVDGTETLPAYSFANDSDTGFYSDSQNEVVATAGGREKLRITNTGILINETIPDSDIPLVIKSNGENRFIAFKEPNNNSTIFNLNWRGAGINFDDSFDTRFFIGIVDPLPGDNFVKGTGINTNQPLAILDINGNLRVQDVPSSPGNLPALVIDAEGFIFKSTTTTSTGKSSLLESSKGFAARWTNASTSTNFNGLQNILPIFGTENYKDGSTSLYEANLETLVVKESGRYDLRANISLIGNEVPNNRKANISARLYINSIPKGAINVANNNGDVGGEIQSSIHISEILELNSSDVLNIQLISDVRLSQCSFNEIGSSNFTIIKL